jgi:hypothetical protein
VYSQRWKRLERKEENEMKINNLVEEIFAQAVALTQSGNLRSTIYAMGKTVFILNMDETVLLRFRLRDSEVAFEHPISFRANDYDSNEFEEKDGKIIFLSGNEEFERKKSCGVPGRTPEQIQDLFNSYSTEGREYVTISNRVLELLDDSLSHIEFSGNRGEQITIIQRNIYSGAVVEIRKKEGKGLLSSQITKGLPEDFGPVAIRTSDFVSMFSFLNPLEFSFPVDSRGDFFTVRGTNPRVRDMFGVISACLYDEIIQIEEARHGRREEQKVRRRK